MKTHVHPETKLIMNVLSFICNSQKLETAQMSIIRLIKCGKYKEQLLSNKKEPIDTHDNMDTSQNNSEWGQQFWWFQQTDS